jgi:putative SbcD/Mre11-related phosphoesterase
LLAPEGAAIHMPQSVAVIADVHLGYEWSRGSGGDVVPAHSLAETQAKLRRLLRRVSFERLIVAGDLLESTSPCLRSRRDLAALRTWLDSQGVELIWLRGNHDPRLEPPLPRTVDIAGWSITHGDRKVDGTHLILGHHHPALRVGSVNAPCFVVGPKLIVLPAFSPNAAGLDISSASLPKLLRCVGLRCFAGTTTELLDFGPLETLRAQLRVVGPRGR